MKIWKCIKLKWKMCWATQMYEMFTPGGVWFVDSQTAMLDEINSSHKIIEDIFYSGGVKRYGELLSCFDNVKMQVERILQVFRRQIKNTRMDADYKRQLGEAIAVYVKRLENIEVVLRYLKKGV